MLDVIRIPIGYVIEFCYKIIPNYALALLLFALIMKILLFPFGIKQQKNMVKQASLRPKEEAIKKRYAGRTDKTTQQKMQQEIMQLYQDEHYSPLSGCLPMILQLVIVFALYAVVMNPLRYLNHVPADNVTNVAKEMAVLYDKAELKTESVSETTRKALAAMAEKIGDDGSTDNVKNSITGIDMVNLIRENGVDLFRDDSMLGADFKEKDLPNFCLFGDKIDLSKTPTFSPVSWLLLIPILTFAFTFLSMKLTRKFSYQTAATGDAAMSMKMMDYAMPLMSTVFTFSVPAVIAVYWIYQNVLGTLQQFILKTLFPFPTFSEEEYKAVEREMNKGIKPDKSAKKSGRAAHRIDLEDEDTPDGAADPVANAEKPSPDTGKKGSALIPPASLKDESDKKSDRS